MQQSLLANAPYVAIAVVITAFVIVVCLKLGVSEASLTIIILAGIVAGLCWLAFAQGRALKKREQQTKLSRLIADRVQALLEAVPGGYCLFTPQGLLRESVRAPQVLGIDKISHADDIIGSLKDAPSFVDAFRRLQLTGDGFAVTARLAKDGRPVQISGRRFRAGRDGPLIDVLWFNADPIAAQMIEKQAASLGTALKRASAAQAMIDALPYPIWARGKDLNLILCNRAYATALDTNPEDAIKAQTELTSQATRGGSARALASTALSSGKTEKGRRHIIIGGKRYLFQISEIPFGDAAEKENNENEIALLGFAVDVSAEEEKDSELQRHLAAEHEVLENLGSAIVIYGADMRIQFYNRAYQRLWGAEEAFLNSKPAFGEVLEDLRVRRRAPEQADFQRYKKERTALFTSLIEPREDLMHLPDGTSLRILAVPHPLGGIMFVHEDVTDKLALESSYNTLIAVQRETLDNLAEGIAVFGPDGKLRLYNPAFARIWGLSSEFLLSNPHVADLFESMKPLFSYGAHWPEFKNEMVEYTLDRTTRRGRIERADQTVIEYITVPLPDGAALNSYLDVTDSFKVEQALRASNSALAAADRLKSEFVANVSYQLRTPLNTIMGFAEILTNQYFGTLNERQAEYARTIMDASRKLLLLINDVLDLATIEAGRMALERKPVGVAGLLNAVKTMAAEWARQQSLELLIDCPSDIGTFDADEQRMKQALFNLVSNAIKYTPPGGRVTLQARQKESWLALSVIDTGIGIPETDRERVFGKFERANAQARQSGAGLGLSLVKSFIELHGGRIEIESAPGKGTRITCFLPVVVPVAQAQMATGT
jgi:signal transduction histidine kinase